MACLLQPPAPLPMQRGAFRLKILGGPQDRFQSDRDSTVEVAKQNAAFAAPQE